jgi:ethanolamine utilization protein EutN
MTLAKVIGTVVATMKSGDLAGHKLLVLQPVDPEGKSQGRTMVGLDTVQAGEGDTVLVIDEGNSSRMILGEPMAAVRTVVVGIVDRIESGGGQ